ncbi:MAG: metalloregulator ArsR/SmtB family transcription factor [Nanoarchaeota archaeon]
MDRIFHALSDETRIKIIEALKDGEICACQFVAMTGKAQPTVSQHLRVLEQAKILRSRKEGKMVLYALRDRRIIDLITKAREIR